jgi:hypothetical protein
MSQNKNAEIESFEENIQDLTSKLGYAAMSMAAVLTLVELHAGRGHKEAAVLQPAYATVVESPQFHGGEDLRREREKEGSHSSVSYGTTMRSHPTAGRQ